MIVNSAQGLAGLRPGETVVDLGIEAGADCFLAGRQVGPTGRVIGIAASPEALARARDDQQRLGAENVEFRLGEVDNLPLADRSVDVLISSGSLQARAASREVVSELMRVLKPGGRLIAVEGLPAREKLQQLLLDAGFERVDVRSDAHHESSAAIRAVRPKGQGCCGSSPKAPCC